MPRKFLITILAFALLTQLPAFTHSGTTVSAASIIDVYPGQSIQSRIDSAQPGDTILVHAGLYHETLSVTKSLTLIGESKENTIIDGDEANRTVIEVTASNVAITGFTVQNSSRTAGTSYAGIKILGQSCNITDNHVTKTKMGIFVTSQNTRIVNNVATGNGHGIALYSSSNTTVKGNNVSANTVGISLALSNNNIVEENTARNSSTGGHGMILQSNSYDNTIRRNDLIFNYHGIWLSSSPNNQIINNTIAFNNLLGIELASSSNNIFHHNNFINNGIQPFAPVIKHILSPQSISVWDDGYPSGGNYWHDYTNVDEKYGPSQDQDGNDGIWDNPYIINENNKDNYPSVRPYRDISHIISDEEKMIAQAGSDKTVKVGTTVSFDASGSTGNILTYEWDFGDETTETGVTPSHTYYETGTYTVTLTVKDAGGNNDTDRLTVTVIADDVLPVGASSPWISALAGVIVIVMVAALFWKRRARTKRRRRSRKYR